MTTFFTADNHFGHEGIVRMCQRPFTDVADMDDALIANWNAVVGPGDDVWHLGDFSYRAAKDFTSYAKRLHGRIHLIYGNHDSEPVRKWGGWASSQQMAEIKVDGQHIVLLHYGMRVWPRSHHGAIHLYGHSHGNLPGDNQSVDVGVDYPEWAMRPVSLPEIMGHLKTLPARDPGQPQASAE